MKALQILIENINWLLPKVLLMEYDGRFVLKRKARQGEMILNQVIIPSGNKEKQLLYRQVVKCIRKGVVTLGDELLLTHDNRVIPNRALAVKQFQSGGYNVKQNVVRNKRRRLSGDEQQAAKKRKLDDELSLDWLFLEEEMVNVKYSIEFVTHFSDYDHQHTKSGFLRNILRDKVTSRLQTVAQEYVKRQAYPTEQIKVNYHVQPVPEQAVELVDERMFGAVL